MDEKRIREALNTAKDIAGEAPGGLQAAAFGAVLEALLRTTDMEVAAMTTIVEALRPLSIPARRRIIAYMEARYG